MFNVNTDKLKDFFAPVARAVKPVANAAKYVRNNPRAIAGFAAVATARTVATGVGTGLIACSGVLASKMWGDPNISTTAKAFVPLGLAAFGAAYAVPGTWPLTSKLAAKASPYIQPYYKALQSRLKIG